VRTRVLFLWNRQWSASLITNLADEDRQAAPGGLSFANSAGLLLGACERFKCSSSRTRSQITPRSHDLQQRTNTVTGRDRCRHRHFAVDVSVSALRLGACALRSGLTLSVPKGFGAHLLRSP